MFVKVLESFLLLAAELVVLFLVVSFLINVLQGFIPYDRFNRYMDGSHVLVSSFAALLLAFVTPFCSCSTIPFVVSLLQNKTRFSVVMVFLFASPVLDPTIITLMAVLLGVKVAVAYTVITGVLAVVIGLSLEKLGFQTAVKDVIMRGGQPAPAAFSLQTAWQEMVKLMKTVGPYLILGAAIGAVINGAVPDEWIAGLFSEEAWWLVPVAAVIGIPLYIRLSAMIPMSAVLLAKGMAIAPVMALMISSAGASLPEITLLNSIFQKRLVAAFIASVVTMSSVSGFLFYLI
ncbi:permease [Planococcus lenghuensis]|uniref:Permease n=1 Tax=Planococcus lenghuensis TaxID=2213202 RepID=A0A1Q2KYV8_9BACL|nr:permease [Planococcus lenghuensis]AQQ53333.1 permease [Planococcus lenghuensis]